MRYKQQCYILEQKKNALLELRRRMIKQHYSHKRYLEERSAILATPKGFPIHYKEYLRGFTDSLVSSLYYTEVFSKHSWNGLLYDGWDNLPESGKEYYRKNSDASERLSSFYWKNSFDKFS